MKKLIIALTGIVYSFTSFSQAPYELPKLNYGYDAFVNNIDKETMQIHYEKHHAGYVSNLNKALEGKKFANLPLEVIVLNATHFDNAIRNNAGGHYNHTMFWTILTPEKNQKPSEKLLSAINNDFGNFENMLEKLNDAASKRFGSGWAWLIVTPDKKLAITSTPNQDNPIMDVEGPRGLPILGIDVWEHAYYLKYQNKRADYLKSIVDIINWNQVSKNYENALANPFLKEIEKDSWKELNNFHEIMAITFHSAEKGNFEPIRTRHMELAEKATALKQGTIPASFNNEVVKNAVEKLEQETQKMCKIASGKKVTDKQLMEQLEIVHKAFHDLSGSCEH